MNTRFREVGISAAVLTLAGVLGGCNNGSGAGLVNLFFGINGSGSCSSVIVDVNLTEASATIAHSRDGSPRCTINPVLAGCTLGVVETSDGDHRATVSGTSCTISAVTSLFSCEFEDVDISKLQDTASSQCACKTAGCDTTPPVCISPTPDPTSCENCTNGIDDNGNGLIDCVDPNCADNPVCRGSTTTTSTSSSTSYTGPTNTTTTTSTTLPLACTILFHLDDDVNLGSLQFDTDYSNAQGYFLGEGGSVQCSSTVTGALTSFNDKDAQHVLSSGIISLNGFTGPTYVSECTFKSSATPVSADFGVTVTEASYPNLVDVVPLPVVSIALINCEWPPDTFQPTTTTTPEPTTTTLKGLITVTYRLISASSSVGALQWSTSYAGAPGGFRGTGSAVVCSNLVKEALFAPNDDEANSTLNLALIALTPFTAPTDLVQCTFDPNVGQTPTADQFPVTIQDATDSDGNKITAAIGVTAAVAP
ncbi:MAG TPA: hypothetical protein VGK20_04570 [Candidatus Binatia bacterium]